jgi:hypothetical protein
VEARLTERNEYFRKNRGEYSDGQDSLGFLRDVGLRHSEREALERAQTIFNEVRNQGLDLLEGSERTEGRERKPLAWFTTTASLDSA